MMLRYNNVIQCVKESKPSVIVDIGVWNGLRSSEILYEASKYKNDIQYYGFDLWEDMTDNQWVEEVTFPKKRSTFEEAKYRIEASGVRNINLIKGNTRDTLYQTNLPQVDFAYIDGGHSLDTIISDWNRISLLMHERSVVLFDDYWHNRDDAGCKSIIDNLDNRFIVDLVGYDCVNGLKISMAKVKMQTKE